MVGKTGERFRARLSRCSAGVVLALALLLSGEGEPPQGARDYPEPVPLRVAGVVGNRSSVGVVAPGEAQGASYLPASNVLRLPDGRLRYLPPGAREPVTVPPGDAGANRFAAGTRTWLERGTVPGDSELERLVAERALLDLRLLIRPNGASIASPHPGWDYVWPRDASWAAVAFAATGHHGEAYSILRFLAAAQEEDGTWHARYRTSGEPVLDGRPYQLDANGWFAWAVWYSYTTDPRRDRAVQNLRGLWPALRSAADVAEGSLSPLGLPPGGPDYWEKTTLWPNLGTAAPLRTGLRSVADLADELGRDEDARRYAEAADRLDEAIAREFAPRGYPRTARPGSGADAAVNFLAPPFAPPAPGVSRAVEETAEKLTAPNGGVLPGEDWPHNPTVSWTPETAFFALSAAAGGDAEEADRWLRWLAAHRTSLGAFPEKVDDNGKPRSAAPLGWTSAIVLLALAAKEEPLPVPPVP